MAWDDTGARQVAGQLADSFFLGNDPNGYFRTQVANKEMALRQAHDARAQAVHDAQMRDYEQVAAARSSLADAVKNQGLPIPAGQVGGDGMGPPTPAGLSTTGPSQRQLLNMQARLAATMGDNATVTKLRAEGEGMDRKERQKSFMEPFTKLTDEQLANHPTIRGMFNDNPDVKGTLVFDPKSKKWIVADYDGKGSVKTLKRGEIMAALGAHFDEQEGEFDTATKTRMGLDDRRFNQARQGVQDTNAAVTGAHRMNTDEARLGIDRQRLGMEGARLGLEQQRINKPVLQQFIDERTGQPVLLDMNKVPVDPKTGQATLPQGVKFPKQSLDASALLRFRTELIKSGMPPLQVEQEMARVTGGEDPVEKLARSLKAANDAAESAKKQRGMPQPEATKNPASTLNQPTPRRGGVGQGSATFPWEAPTGQY